MSTDYTLAFGTHATPEDGRCAMEWVSFLAGEPHSDDPACVSPVLRAYCTTLNDSLEDGPRQLLRPYLARTIGTSADGLDEHRSWMAMDWLIRTYAPAWLSAAGLPGPAQRLAELPPVLDGSALPGALAGLKDARRRDPRLVVGGTRPGPCRGSRAVGCRSGGGSTVSLELGRRRRLGSRARCSRRSRRRPRAGDRARDRRRLRRHRSPGGADGDGAGGGARGGLHGSLPHAARAAALRLRTARPDAADRASGGMGQRRGARGTASLRSARVARSPRSGGRRPAPGAGS